MQEFKNGQLMLSTEVYNLWYFKPEKLLIERPVLVIPPHAGRHGNIAQRMIDTCVAQGCQVFTIELLSATYKTRNTSIADLVEMIYDCQSIINVFCNTKVVDLIGLCQGAWLAAIYTAKYQDRVARYANFAGPINTKTGCKNNIEEYCKNINMGYHQFVVAIHGGIQPGYMQWLAFSFVNPAQVYIQRWFDYFNALVEGNEKEIAKQKRNNDWYDTPMDLAGNWFLDCLENHFTLNKLYDGTWFIGDDYVDLGNITCDIYLYGGEDDEITHPQQVFDMSKKVKSRRILKTTFPGAGHTKVFVGTQELAQFVKDFF